MYISTYMYICLYICIYKLRKVPLSGLQAVACKNLIWKLDMDITVSIHVIVLWCTDNFVSPPW